MAPPQYHRRPDFGQPKQANDISTWIEIEGVPTQEYSIEVTKDEEDRAVVTCWIVSEEGKTFGVHFRDKCCCVPIQGTLRVDGASMGGLVLEPAQNSRPSEISGAIKDMPISASENSPFVFFQNPHDCTASSVAPFLWGTSPREGSGATDSREVQESWTTLHQCAPLELLRARGIAPRPSPTESASASPTCSPDPGARSARANAGEINLLKQQSLLIQKRLDEMDSPRGVKREPDASSKTP
ncbi:hypothetical protein BDN71DRAFT_1432699 [Pleurotus eryngii]|uniref:Uncharacterized protein n=1 Tax=Pleurotus eryngii TaxID=5323 RepID=A0A9P5ZSX4_PLEER|nr:hypothetical protein BDN71DRAFT_1432699 [Pleurotus eryngii]